MPTVYFIGGAPRSGKTTVIQELIQKRPILAASTDAIRSVAKGLIAPDTNPRLHKTGRGMFGSKDHVGGMRNHPEVILAHELGEAEETWKSVLDFIGYYQKDGKDVAIEGVAVLPERLSEVTFDYKAVFIASLTNQTEIILEHARQHPEDWLAKYDEETIRAYAAFNQSWNRYYADEARRYGLPVVEIDPDNFQASIKQAAEILLN